MHTPTLLVVDDDPSVLDLASTILSTKGYRVMAAADAGEALQAAASHKAEIVLLLSDIAMPGMTGLELAKHFAAQRPKAKILFITAYAERFDVGNYPILPKPFTPDQLIGKVKELLSGPILRAARR